MDSALIHALPVRERADYRRLFALGATLVAIAVYPIGIALPALTVEKMGRVRESSVLDGVRNLFTEGRIFLAFVIGITALVLPPLKMAGLICLGTSSESNPLRRRFAPILTLIGRWGFLDLFVAGLLVAWVQMNSLIRFEPRIGLIFFGISVLSSYLASISLDPTDAMRIDIQASKEPQINTDASPVAITNANKPLSVQPRENKRRTRFIALLAAVALLLGLGATGLYYRQSRNQLEVTVHFDNAHGLRTGAEVRHRGVIVGKVTAVHIRPNSQGVQVRIRLQSEAEELAREGSSFYIVRPTVSLSNGIRGLDTAIGDVYMEIGRMPSADGMRKTEFTGNEEPPLPDLKVGSRHYKFTAKRLTLALTAGAPVKCSGFPIGHIRNVALAADGRNIEGSFVVDKEYLHLMDTQTKFTGVSLILAEGSMLVKLRVEVPALSGGIEVKHLPAKPKEPAVEGFSFVLEE